MTHTPGLPLDRAREYALARPHSRYPVVDGSPDVLIGFVHVRDLLADDAAHPRTVRDIVRPAVVMPTTKPVLAALAELQEVGGQIAVVADEFGGTAGIVTMDDLVEQLIGDIRDEYDAPALHGAPGSETESLDGRLTLDAFARRTGITLPDGPYETLGGFLMDRLGRLPVPGDAVEVAGHHLTVVGVDGWRVSEVRVTGGPAEAAAGS